MARIFVPNAATIRQARSVMTGADFSVGGDTTVAFHPSYCHMQPWVLSALAAWALAHREAGGTINVENANRAMYAWRFGLGEYFDVDVKSAQRHEEAGRFIPLRRVSTASDLSQLLSDMVTLLHVDLESSKAVMYAMSEMVRNTLEHSRARYGAIVCAQSYPGSRGRRYVSIGIADAGQGIRASLGTNYPFATDRKAVLEAIKPGVSGATGRADNAGAGLFITRRLSAATGGYFAVGSGEAMFRSSLAQRPPSEDRLMIDIPHYPGTIVSVELGLDPDADFARTFAEAREAFGSQIVGRRTDIAERVRFS